MQTSHIAHGEIGELGIPLSRSVTRSESDARHMSEIFSRENRGARHRATTKFVHQSLNRYKSGAFSRFLDIAYIIIPVAQKSEQHRRIDCQALYTRPSAVCSQGTRACSRDELSIQVPL
jgi:hypothetical protein